MTTLNDLTLPRSASVKEILAKLRRWGIVVLPDYLDASTVTALVAEHKEAQEKAGPGISVWPSFAGTVAEFTPHEVDRRTYAQIGEVFQDPLFKITAEKYLGRPCYFNFEVMATHEYKTNIPIIELHYDKIWTLKNYFYLTDADTNSGAIWFVPGSHRWGRQRAREYLSKTPAKILGVSETYHQQFPNTITPSEFPPAIPITATAGTLIIFDTDTFHHAGALQPGRERRILRTASGTIKPPIRRFRAGGRQWWRGARWNPARWLSRLCYHRTGVPRWQALTGGTNGSAWLELGEAHIHGWGVDRDVTRAAAWWRKAANRGNAAAAYALGHLFAKGDALISPDLDAAVKNWQQAAARGHAKSMMELAKRYGSGDGVSPDENMALALWQRAAECGDALSMVQVGRAHKQGERAAWFDKAYLNALESYQRNDFAEAVGVLKLLVDNVHVPSMNLLAECYRRGVAVDQDLSRSVELWTQAVERGDGSAACAMAESYWTGLPGLEQNQDLAVANWRLAVELGYEPARARLDQAHGERRAPHFTNSINSSKKSFIG